MRGKAINYDTGFSPGGNISRADFDADIVRREMRVIATCRSTPIPDGTWTWPVTAW